MRFFIIIGITVTLWILNPALPSSNTIRPGQPVQGNQQQQPEKPSQGGQPSEQSRQPGNQAEEQGAGDDRQGNQAGQQGEEKGNQAQAGEGAQQDGASQRATEEPGQKASGEDSKVSLNTIGNPRPDVSGQPLVLPENSENMDFLNGEWSFDKQLSGTDGEILSWDFSEKNGTGVAVLKDGKNNRYEARMSAKLEDGVLRMRTDNFTSPTSSKVYNSEYIECRNGPNGAVCKGSDGFGEWNGEQIYRAMGNIPQSDIAKGAPATKSADVAELAADGPEIPEDILQRSQKATMSQNNPLASLEGHWRYSQDLARKADGEPVTMEFHFDKNGKGYSLIKGGNEGDFRADATAVALPNGNLRIKTDEYSNGKGKGYFPTFVECQGKDGQALACNLSNGWMHSDNGRLVDLQSYEENAHNAQMEDLMPGMAEGDQNEPVNMEEILASAAESAQKAADGQKEGKSLELPKSGDSVAFMEGKWICHTGLVSTKTGEPVVLEFSFNKDGKGISYIKENQSGKSFKASAQVSFRNGIMRVHTSEYRGMGGGYVPHTIECRDQGGVALCKGRNGGITWNANFERR